MAAAPKERPTMTLENKVMARLKPAKIFKDAIDNSETLPPAARSAGPRHITGLSFDDKGEWLVTASEDETFRIWNCKSGKAHKTLYSKKYGVDLPRFTHKNTNILYASTKEDDTIRYHSIHDNRYLQYFKGHKDRVISLEVSPVDDGFISSSEDRTVRLWDLRTPQCRGQLSLPLPPIVAYDSSGMVFAVAVNEYARILLYDLANFDKAPFLVIHLQDLTLAKISFPPRNIFMTSMSFSSNGKFILIGCSGTAHYIIDAFEGHVLAKLEGHESLERRNASIPRGPPAKGISGEDVSWTPDSKYVVGGSLDGRVLVWNLQDLETRSGDINFQIPPNIIRPLVALEGHPGPTRCVRWNPRFSMLCSAGTELAFWLPAEDEAEVAKELLRKKVDP
ncbi:WD40-repeat-containing domain protein [Flagelloscypha sp. PMI_526]|nr:WD40-repeat-containing domain protein [Flagelloscypha sp. PMI_526]